MVGLPVVLVGDAIKYLLKPIAHVIGMKGKGKATGLGAITVVAGTALQATTGTQIVTAENVVPLVSKGIEALSLILQFGGVIIAAWGHGRHVGASTP